MPRRSCNGQAVKLFRTTHAPCPSLSPWAFHHLPEIFAHLLNMFTMVKVAMLLMAKAPSRPSRD
jgi:hypothetical protein